MANSAVSLVDADIGIEKTAKNIKKIVPWEMPEMFLRVYEYLYSPELTKKRWAVDELAVWESRCHPSLGTAIESSVVITRAIIQDVLMSNRTSLCQEKEIQIMYSMALIRFVNLSVELHQPETKQSTSQIAKGLGIPSWIVDLRNEATHSFIPSLPVLRMAAEAAMQYLDKVFWSVEASIELKMAVNEPFSYENITELLFLYRTQQYHIIISKEKTEEVSREIEDMKTILRKLEIYISKSRKEVFEILLQDGIFIPFEEELKCFLTHGEQKVFKYKSDDSYQNDDCNSSKHDNFEEDDDDDMPNLPNVPILLQKLWCPLLRIMNKYHAIPDFIESLLFTQHLRYPIGQKILLSWVMQILLLHPGAPGVRKVKIREIFSSGNAIFDWNRLLYAAIAYPCKYTVFIFPLLISRLNLEQKHIRYLMNLLAISQGLSLAEGCTFPDDCPIFTLQELKKHKMLQDSKRKEKRKVRKIESLFKEGSDLPDLKNVAIGYNFCIREDDKDKICLESNFEPESVENSENTEKFLLCNENDNEEDGEIIVTTNLNTFEDDKRILSEKGSFLYKKIT